MMNDNKLPKGIYVHGFDSEANTDTLQSVRKHLPLFDWYAVEVNEDLAQSVKIINDAIEMYHPNVLLGTSSSGLYLMYVNVGEAYRIICNPACNIAELIRYTPGYGVIDYFVKSQDGTLQNILDEDVCRRFEQYIQTHTPTKGKHDYALFCIHDELIGAGGILSNQAICFNNGYTILIEKKAGHRLESRALNLINRCVFNQITSKYYNDIEQLAHYYKPGTLNIIAGRPAMGKTTIAVNLAAILRQPVAYFSLEKSVKDLINTDGFDNEDGLIHIDDTPQLKVGELKSRSRKLKEEYSIKMIFVDYIELLNVDMPNDSQISRAEQLKIIAKELKSIATELQIPVVAISQLARPLEKRYRPMLCDFGEGKGMLDCVDDVRLLYRPADYGINEALYGRTMNLIEEIYYGILESMYENTMNLREIIPTEKNYGENEIIIFDKEQ